MKLRPVAILLLAGCAVADPLDWVDHADPARIAKQDIAAGRFRFLEICGVACELAGIGGMTYARCYSGFATVETVEGTSDVIRSERHLRLQDGSGLGERTRASICSIVAQHGIQRLVRFGETLGDIDAPERTLRFSCEAGKLGGSRRRTAVPERTV